MSDKAESTGKIIDLMAALKESLRKSAPCLACGGRGWVQVDTDVDYDHHECAPCGGSGFVLHSQGGGGGQ